MSIRYRDRSILISSGLTETGETQVEIRYDRVDNKFYFINPQGSFYDLAGNPYTPTPIYPDEPIANFSVSSTSVFVNGVVTFTNQSTGLNPKTYLWNFGDENTSTATSPTHSYAEVGTYSVSLTVTNALGENTMTMTDLISVTEQVVCQDINTITYQTPFDESPVTITLDVDYSKLDPPQTWEQFNTGFTIVMGDNTPLDTVNFWGMNVAGSQWCIGTLGSTWYFVSFYSLQEGYQALYVASTSTQCGLESTWTQLVDAYWGNEFFTTLSTAAAE